MYKTSLLVFQLKMYLADLLNIFSFSSSFTILIIATLSYTIPMTQSILVNQNFPQSDIVSSSWFTMQVVHLPFTAGTSAGKI